MWNAQRSNIIEVLYEFEYIFVFRLALHNYVCIGWVKLRDAVDIQLSAYGSEEFCDERDIVSRVEVDNFRYYGKGKKARLIFCELSFVGSFIYFSVCDMV